MKKFLVREKSDEVIIAQRTSGDSKQNAQNSRDAEVHLVMSKIVVQAVDRLEFEFRCEKTSQSRLDDLMRAWECSGFILFLIG